MSREFGATAWGHAWLRQLEPTAITGAPDRDLPPARTLARRCVTNLTIENHRVTARITHRTGDHTITLDIPPWTRQEQRTAMAIIDGADIDGAGDLPDHLAIELDAAGVKVAPSIQRITVTSDHAPATRRHVLAVCYALIQRIDEEPVIAVRLRITRPARPTYTEQPGLIALGDIDPTCFYVIRRCQSATR